jgi:2'-5' RNA ligase
MHINLSLRLYVYHLRKNEVDLSKKQIPSKFLQASIYSLTKTLKPKHFPFQILFGFSTNIPPFIFINQKNSSTKNAHNKSLHNLIARKKCKQQKLTYVEHTKLIMQCQK